MLQKTVALMWLLAMGLMHLILALILLLVTAAAAAVAAGLAVTLLPAELALCVVQPRHRCGGLGPKVPRYYYACFLCFYKFSFVLICLYRFNLCIL